MTIIATATVRSALRLIDADTVPLPRPAQSARLTCPTWCDQTCGAIEGNVIHGNTIATISDTLDGELSTIVVEVERFDRDGRAGQAYLNIQQVKGPGGLGPVAAAALADAIQRANAIVIADRAQHAGGAR